MRIYVGTYAKYNSGNLDGAWFDLSDYSDKAEFIHACMDFHNTESDPEFMFQDWENIPAHLISESHINDDVFHLVNMDEDDREMLEAYMAYSDSATTLEEARDAYQGTYESGAAFAEEWVVESGAISEDSPMFSYIDFEHYWNADLRHSFFIENGHVFSSY